MTQSTLIGWTNLAKGALITANSSAANMPPANIAQDQGAPSAGWQSAAGVTTATLFITPQGVAARPTWDAVGVFRTNLTSKAVVTIGLWLLGPSNVASASVSPVNGYGQAIAIFGGVAADYATINIADPANPDGFLNVPLAFAGPAWRPAIAMSWNSTFGRDDSTDEVIARGGQEFPVKRWTRRRLELRLEGIQQAELWTQQAELDRYARGGSNVLVVPSVLSSTIQREAIFGRLKATADVTFPNGPGDARAWSSSITERL